MTLSNREHNLINKEAVKRLTSDMAVSTDYYPYLDKVVSELIKKSVYRAQKNNRRTLMARDV